MSGLKRYFLKKKVLWAVGVILILISSIYLWRVRVGKISVASNPELIMNKADVQVEKMELSETRAGYLEWNLKAEKAEVYEKQGLAYLKNITLKYLLTGGERVVLTGDKGKINLSKKDIFLQGNVGVRSGQIQLKTDTLSWDREKKLLLTEDSVWLKRENIEITGKGMIADINLGKIKLNSEIRTAIY